MHCRRISAQVRLMECWPVREMAYLVPARHCIPSPFSLSRLRPRLLSFSRRHWRQLASPQTPLLSCKCAIFGLTG